MPELLDTIRIWPRIAPSRKSLIESYGVCHSAGFVHLDCLNEFTKLLPTRDRIIFHAGTCDLSDASTRPRDISHCDVCGKEFQEADKNGLVIRTPDLSELKAYLRLQSRRARSSNFAE